MSSSRSGNYSANSDKIVAKETPKAAKPKIDPKSKEQSPRIGREGSDEKKATP
jgi:hypothetical protein